MKFVYKNLYITVCALALAFVLVMPSIVLAQNGGTTGGSGGPAVGNGNPGGGFGDPVGTEDPGGNFGDPVGSDGTVLIENPIKVNDFISFIKTLLEGVIKVGIPIIALALVYSGFLFVTATGNSEKINKAKDAFIYALIGGGILLASWAIAQMISDTVLQIS